MDFRHVESKWQKEWEKAGIFEPKAGEGEKFYLTAAYPYPNSPQHIGHARTYTTTDIYARYLRMRGKNVLFPMAFHVTGTPILAMAKRIASNDKELLEIFDKIYGIAPEKARELSNPKDLVLYFSKEIEMGMKEMGYSIDWRRKFYTFDAIYNRFIQWQFRKLYAAGYITKGKHPIPWCPSDKQPVGGHDTKGDVDPQLEEVSVIFFESEGGFIPTTTYRPETLFGVTNLWANPDAHYVLAEMKLGSISKKIYLAQQAFEFTSHQVSLSKIRDVPSSEILSLSAIHPIDKRKLPVLPAQFVDPATGTGLVMSVPAHAPYDWLALQDLGKLDELAPIQVLEVGGFGSCPAGELCKRMGIKSQKDLAAEEATRQLYKIEAHEGKMKIPPYAGLSSMQAREKIKKELSSAGLSMPLYIIANAPVYCRCGAACVVKNVENQWFINYGDEGWKKKAREALAAMRILPEALRHEYEYTIDWLQEKACTRASGLGTRFPFDESQMIEALSDSTLYMAFYTIAHIAKKMEQEGRLDEIDDKFFDFVFLGIEPSEEKKKSRGWNDWVEARREFLYWYPLDSRHSAHDLIHNHLTFFIFNHTAIFEKKYWPRQTVSNGFVTMDGKKMSKSMGNIMPLRKAILQYGADVVRFLVTSSAELDSDSDFNQAAAEGVIMRISLLENYLEKALDNRENSKAANQPASNRSKICRWFYSRFHSRLLEASSLYENFKLRPLAKALFYDTINDLQWYSHRSQDMDLQEFFELWSLAIAPFMPHVAEEFWARLGNKKYAKNSLLAATAPFPQADASQIDAKIEAQEQHIKDLMDDIRRILQIIKIQKPSSIIFIVHSPWKMKVRKLVAEKKNIAKVVEEAKKDSELAPRISQVSLIASKLLKNLGSLNIDVISAQEELELLNESREFLSSQFGGAKIEVIKEEDASPQLAAKASNSMPGKPSIVIS